MKTIRVLIVDDSELVRSILTSILSDDPEIQVVGTATDPFVAREKIKQLNPDVITLDVEMPRMDGITFLKNLMRLRPTRVVMISTLTQQGANITLEALDIGAIDFIAKPRVSKKEALLELEQIICQKVKSAAQVSSLALGASNVAKAGSPVRFDTRNYGRSSIDLITIGASTGGTTALRDVLAELPENMPPIVIVQHMPEHFTASFAQRLDKSCALTVLEVNRSGTALQSGHVYLARGGDHLKVLCKQDELVAMMDHSDPVSGHKPSVNVLFNSAAKLVGLRCASVLLTGMGSDGATGMERMKTSGAITVAQDENSSVVWGMPRVAVEAGVVDKVLPLPDIADFLVSVCYPGQLAKRSKTHSG